MLTVDEKLTKVADNKRKAEIFLRSDNKDHMMARDELTCMDAGNKAIAVASDLKVPDPRITSGPTVVPLDKEGNPMTDLTKELGGYGCVFEVAARLV